MSPSPAATVAGQRRSHTKETQAAGRTFEIDRDRNAVAFSLSCRNGAEWFDGDGFPWSWFHLFAPGLCG